MSDGPSSGESSEPTSVPIVEAGQLLANSAVASVAARTGRTPDEQWERMGDRFAYAAASDDPSQRQLDDYETAAVQGGDRLP